MKSNFKKILIIEESPEINNAIKMLDKSEIQIFKEPILNDNWLDELKKYNINNHPLISKYGIEISKDNILLKSFFALFTNKYDGIVVGHLYTSKLVFIYSIIFFGNDGVLSSCFVHNSNNIVNVWTDCALNINPNIDIFKSIIINSIDFYINNIKNKKEINVHLLSFSTFEKSNDSTILIYYDLISDQKWLNKFNDKNINLIGPIQYDASVNEIVFYKKTQLNKYYKPDILVFPNLNAGNLCYKVESQYSKFYGPFVCGINKKVADLSRSATSDEIHKTILYLCGLKR